MDPEYEVLYKLSKSSTFTSTACPTKVENLEKRMNDIKKKKVCQNCDRTWCNKSKISSKIYDNWYSPLNDKALKLDSSYMQLAQCDYQGLVDLLFTSGELDTDKIICLHVLASHPCDKLTLPANSNVRFETQTALDKLVERSKSFCGYRSGIKYNLPIYILNLNEARRQYLSNKAGKKYLSDSKFEDGRLATRLVINENLWRLVQTVIEALHRCNPAKMVYLLKIAHNVNYVRHVINKPPLQSFIKALLTQNIVLSSDSFLLTRPFETCIELKIENPSHNLEMLIRKIRKRVLNDQCFEAQKLTVYDSDIMEGGAKKKYDNYRLRGLKRELDICLNFCNFDAEKISTILNTKIREAQEKDMKKIRRPVTAPTIVCTDACCPARKHQCYACTEKWRNHMISPQKVAKKSSRCLENFKPSYSHSTHWLKLIIQEEEDNLEKLQTENVIPSLNQPVEEPFQKKPMVLNISEKKRFAKMSKTLSNEQTHPNSRYAENNLNLAKIRNDISIKENKKRIKKFLDEPIYAKKEVAKKYDYGIIPI